MAQDQSPVELMQAQVDRLADSLDKARLAEYVDLQTNTRRLLYLSFVAGGGSGGFGMAWALPWWERWCSISCARW